MFKGMVIADASLASTLKLLADSTRLRILALLEREELTVGELTRALGMAQSRVSNHLRLLRDAGLLTERHAGVSTHLRLAAPENGHSVLRRLWGALKNDMEDQPEHAADLVRLDAVLVDRRARDGDFFDRVAGEWNKIAGDFRSGQARLRVATHLLPEPFVVADLGCGTGYIAEALAGSCSRLICVDRSEAMLDEARKRLLRARRSTDIEFRPGDLDRLPISDEELDGVVCGMVLHHLPEADSAIREMFRVLKPGGNAVVLELDPHRETWMRAELGDRHLGLAPSDVLAAFRRAGFEDVRLDPPDDRYQPRRPDGHEASLSLFIARGRKPRS